jgi:hypothetical protein
MASMISHLFSLVALSCLIAGPTSILAQGDSQSKSVPPEAEKSKEGAAKKHRGEFTISKETTYVTGPLDKDGYIDFVAALNERLCKGVTPENNANVLIWKALGPKPEGTSYGPEFCKLMGMPLLPEKGEYFINSDHFMKDRLKIDPRGKEAEKYWLQLERIAQRVWSRKEKPEFAAWLEANYKPLEITIDATKRIKYYSPMVVSKGGKGSGALIGALLPAVQECRVLTNAFTGRAMLRVSEGKFDDAWQDLLACHRLGRLIGSGGTLIEGLAGIAIDGRASSADLAYLVAIKDDGKKIESCLSDLQRLPPFPELADKVNFGERFSILDTIQMVDRHGIRYLEALSNGHSKEITPFVEAVRESIVENIDWNPAFRNANQLFDRMVAAARERDRSNRAREWSRIDADLKTLRIKILESEDFARQFLDLDDHKARGNCLGNMVICLITPAINKVQIAFDRQQQTQDNLRVAFACARYHCDHAQYPKSLDELTPKYLKQFPQDIFSGKPLIYRLTDKGYLLYSVGMNGKDDGGHGPDDDPTGDDLVIRMPPLPELKQK